MSSYLRTLDPRQRICVRTIAKESVFVLRKRALSCGSNFNVVDNTLWLRHFTDLLRSRRFFISLGNKLSSVDQERKFCCKKTDIYGSYGLFATLTI